MSEIGRVAVAQALGDRANGQIRFQEKFGGLLHAHPIHDEPKARAFHSESTSKCARAHTEPGWAPVGERCRDSAPFGHWKTMTFIAGLRQTGMTAPWVLEGPMDGDAFRIYVQHVLAPTLKRGDVVVLDNLPAHKVAGIREPIVERQAQLFYLPLYSPDMNPIENA